MLVAFFALFGCTYAWIEDLPELGNYSATELAQTFVLYDSGSNLIDEL